VYTIPKFNSALEPLVCWSGGFSEEDVNQIITLGDRQQFMDGRVGTSTVAKEGGDLKVNIRDSQITWIEPHAQSEWLFRKICEIVSIINNDKFQFELDGFPSFQYTTYSEGGFYDWHIDADVQNSFGPKHRKLSFSLLLSDPETEFTGGDFQLMLHGNPNNVDIAKMKKGDVVVFPSFVPHKVDKVTSGKRKSLVWWVLGPKFK